MGAWAEHEATLERKLAELQRELERKLTEMRTEHENSIRLMTLQHQETIARIEAGRFFYLEINTRALALLDVILSGMLKL